MSLYSIGASTPIHHKVTVKVKDSQNPRHESQATQDRQSRMALSLHRKWEGERFGRTAGRRGQALIIGGFLLTSAIGYFAIKAYGRRRG
jgi:hypothetical protein